tara:strand:- start:124 stop:405 length:282 start_codon:yes stop_codon:yes gene_type:complete
MAIATDSLDAIFSDLAVTVVAGGVTGKGILDEPTSIVAGDQVLYVDRVLHCKSSDFGTLVGGDSISVDSVNYKVRTCEKDIDGLTCQISLEKV